MDLESMAISLPAVDRHPNRLAFRGVLTLVDATSRAADPPSRRGGAAIAPGHGLDFTPSLDA